MGNFANRSMGTIQVRSKISAPISMDGWMYRRTILATKQPTWGKRSYFYVTCILRGWSGAFRSRGGRKKDESTRARPPASRRGSVARTGVRANNRSYVPHGVHDEWLEKARLETEWQDAKLWIPPSTEFRGIRAVLLSLSLSLSLSVVREPRA